MFACLNYVVVYIYGLLVAWRGVDGTGQHNFFLYIVVTEIASSFSRILDVIMKCCRRLGFSNLSCKWLWSDNRMLKC